MKETSFEAHSAAVRRIDYVKFIFKTDEQQFQDLYKPSLDHINRMCDEGGDKMGKLTALGTDADGLRRYCIEFWGESAVSAVVYAPMQWFNFVYRLDLRQEVPNIESDDLRAIQVYVSVKPTGRTGTSTFTTRPATKNHMRDVGGLGIRFGSRKSDKHAVLYKRGHERTAFEFRIQGRAAQEVGQAMFRNMDSPWFTTRREWLHRVLGEMSKVYLGKVAGVQDPAQLMQLADEAQAYMPMMFHKGNAEELAEAEAWWSELTEDEQLEWQRQGFGPSVKGWKDL